MVLVLSELLKSFPSILSFIYIVYTGGFKKIWLTLFQVKTNIHRRSIIKLMNKTKTTRKVRVKMQAKSDTNLIQFS